MKKVMIYAYTNRNLGDDLFIKVLCERYPQTNFILYAPSTYKIGLNEINNIKIIPFDNLIIRGINFIFKKFNFEFMIRNSIAKNCDLAVYIGGSLFMELDNWENSYKTKRSMLIKNKPFFLLGANFGPYRNEDFYLKYKELFKKYTDICFREKYSYDLFKDLDNVRVADDIIFQLGNSGTEDLENNIVISVIKPSKKHLPNFDEIYYQKIRDIAMYFIERKFNITLMSFCDSEGDEEAIESIIRRIPREYLKNIKKHSYKLNIDETLKVVERSKFVIATRFHAMIIGWVYNKPVFPIAYSKKMTNVINDLGYKGSYTEFPNLENLKPEEVFNSMEGNIIDISKQIKNAAKHFEVLDKYLL
ncbi:polysaccharide pyruvyl transferase family protein [Priestia megaterium]|uniref:polysaccharide pyruvyl transferase family protein n=1 Tax=Priestia megaterium TaxID=1404 RepID=UPI0039A2F87D